MILEVMTYLSLELVWFVMSLLNIHPPMIEAGPEETLFALLDAAVRADRGSAGFNARIAVGVSGSRTRWWIGELGPAIETHRSEQTPADCTAVLILGEDEAQRIVAAAPFPKHPRLFQTFGDAAVLGKFRDRYLDRKNLLELRLARGSSGPRSKP